MYQVFVRDWWKYHRGQLVPAAGAEKEFLDEFESEARARKYCKQFNDENDPGPLSRMAEYESDR